MEGYPWGKPPDRVVRMYIRFRELAAHRIIRDHLGLSLAEWDEQPESFQRWAAQFYQLEADMERNGDA